jgi:hypothetical protein
MSAPSSAPCSRRPAPTLASGRGGASSMPGKPRGFSLSLSTSSHSAAWGFFLFEASRARRITSHVLLSLITELVNGVYRRHTSAMHCPLLVLPPHLRSARSHQVLGSASRHCLFLPLYDVYLQRLACFSAGPRVQAWSPACRGAVEDGLGGHLDGQHRRPDLI